MADLLHPDVLAPDPTPRCRNSTCRRRIEPADPKFEVNGRGPYCGDCVELRPAVN